jgi:hypothetical protein
MSKKQFLWKVFMRTNLLTKDNENDYIAEVSTVGNTARNEDIANAIIAEGSEIKYDTLLNILNRSDRIKRAFLIEGRGVQDGVAHIAPRVSGSWEGANAKFSGDTHSLGFDMTMAPELREELKDVGVEVLGMKDSGAYIGTVTDASTGKATGVITPNEDVIIEGAKIRVAPDDDENCGVFLTRAQTGETVRITKRYTQNDPSKIIARVPELSAGQYTLSVVTAFSNSKQLLKTPRTIVYEQPLSVE